MGEGDPGHDVTREPVAGALLALTAAKLGLHLATSGGYGIFRDELYYVACSERLAWGYVDHPPLSIALLALERALLGDSLAALRFLPAVAGAAIVLVTGLMARELGGGRSAQALAAVCAFAAPQYLAVSHFYSMNVLEVLLWALLGWLALRLLGGARPREWLAFGVLAGLALQNKYQVAVFAVGLAVGLLVTPQRRLLREPRLWGGAAIALAIFAPNLLWQVQQGWPTLEFVANARAQKIHPVTPLEFVWGQVFLLHPFTFPVWGTGLAALLASERLRPWRPLGIAYGVVFAVFLLQQAKVYYLSPIYPLLFAAGGATLEWTFAARRPRWAPAALAGLVGAGGLAAIPATVPVLPVETFAAFQQATGLEEPKTERSETRGLHQLFADMHGWEELVDTVARVHASLPPGERDRVRVLTRNYGEAGAVDFLGPTRGLPPAISGHNSYHLWGPGDFDGCGPLIVVGRSREELSAWFDDVEHVDTVRCRWCMPYQDDLPVFVVRGLRVSLEALWSALRRYM